MRKSSIIIPAYNEEKRIGNTLKEYSLYFNSLVEKKLHDYELIVIINNTIDKTEEIVKKYVKKNERISYINIPGGGKGNAIRVGFEEAMKRKNDFIGFVDADMATSPEEYYNLILALRRADGVIADRYLKDSKVYPLPSFKRLLARKTFNLLIKLLLFIPYSDTQCGAKIFRRHVLEHSLEMLSMSRWAFDVDLIYSIRKKGFKVISHPTIWIDKEYSRINFWQAGPWMAIAIVRLRIINSPFKSFVRIYDKLMFFISK